MSGFPPEFEAMADEMLKPYMSKIAELQDVIEQLQDRLHVYESGTTYSRDDVTKMENQLREEIDKNTQLTRRCRELETNYQTIISKTQALEAQLQRANTDMTSGVREKKSFEDRIDSANKKNIALEANLKKQQEKTLALIEEKNKAVATHTSLSRQNDEMAGVIEEMLAREKEITKVLVERTQYISEVEGNVASLQGKCIKYERMIKKLKQSGGVLPEGDQTLDVTQTDQTATFENVQTELLSYKDKVQQLKMRILQLEEEERRAQRLTDALNKRNKMVDNLQKQLNEKEETILEFHHAKGDLIQQVETYRQRVEEKNRDKNSELVYLKEQYQFYKDSFMTADKRVKDLESLLNTSSSEVDALRKQINGMMEKTYGLPQAVNEMRELRAMLDVRDKHIADLVTQLNSMDKIMLGLSKKVDPNFDLEKFIGEYSTASFDDERIRVEQAARELATKIKILKERGPVAQIKVVLDQDQRPIKTVIVEGEDGLSAQQQDDDNISQAQRHFRRQKSHRTSDSNGKDAVNIPSKQQHKVGQRRFKVESQNNDNDSNSSKNKTKWLNGQPDSGYVSKSCQTNSIPIADLIQDVDAEQIPGLDRWVVNLQKRYLNVEQENDELKSSIGQLKEENKEITEENMSLKDIIEQYKHEINEANQLGRKPSLASISPPRLSMASIPKIPQFEFTNPTMTIDRSKYTDRTIQTKRRKLELGKEYAKFEQISKPRLSKVSFSDNAIILPSASDKAIFDAKQNALKIELEGVRQDSIQNKHQYESVIAELAQQTEIRDKMQATIDALNKKLNEQREAYKETLTNLRNEADRYADSKVREAMDVQQVASRLDGNGFDKNTDLSSVSTRIAELNHIKEKLEEELNEEKASSAMAQKQALQYRQRLKGVEAERDELQAEIARKSSDNQLQEYNAELHIRMRNLEKKYADLRRENYDLKHARPARNDPYGGTEHPIDDTDTENDATATGRESARAARNAEAKIMALRTQNEEMQLRLGKANGTIDRLNQLLQRKEAQLTKLKEQSSAFKQQIIAKQKEVNQLRSKIQMH